MSKIPAFMDLPDTQPAPQRERSAGVAVALAALFGPFGLFYASVGGGLFMLFVCLVVGVSTVGVGLLFAWPVCILWAWVATAGSTAPESAAVEPTAG